MKSVVISVLCFLCVCTAAHAQDAAPAAASFPETTKADDSKEPFVFESYSTKVRFENDGTGERDHIARIRVQSDAGVQALGELIFGYNSANEQMNVQYVRVRKPDGSVVTAEASAVKEMTADVAHNAPVYTDYKEKHITVPSLQPGDTIEYEIDTKLATPLAAGEFWDAQNFLKDAVVLDETLEVNLPQDRAVKMASASAANDTKRESGREIYTWKHTQMARPSSEDGEAAATAESRPDVQFTTFKSWGDVAKWYASLEQGRNEPNAEIRAQVSALTQGKATDREKTQALYDYVAKNIRYVSLSFGLGRYQPHTAAEVLANKYGDCKDKANLLDAMLRAAGISADVALLPSSGTLDETMPSPSQFDHVITAVPLNNALVWMDSTAEVAPFRMLAAPLRDKSALLVSADGKGKIVRTPADPPFSSVQTVDIAGTVNELGKLTGSVHYTVRGDQELFLRLAFRRTAQRSWNQIGNAILQQDGLNGQTTAIDMSDPSNTQNPFDLTIHFYENDFLPWTNKEPAVKLPLLSIGLPPVSEDNAAPIELGSPLTVNVHLKLTLPSNFKARAPVGVTVLRDYADFKSTYSLDGQTLTATRTLNFRGRELPAERTSDYLAFDHAVLSDENQSLHLQNGATTLTQVPPTAKIDDVMAAAEVALKGDDPKTAIPLLQRVLELDPKKYEKGVWNDLGLAYGDAGNYDKAIGAFHKQIEINPYDENTNRYIGLAYARQLKFDEAVAAYRKQLEIKPLDLLAISQLGFTLNLQHKYSDAIPELEKAATIAPDDASIQVALGAAYSNTGANDKALVAYDRATQLAPTPAIWNDVAYDLADKKIQLDKAQRYAESAVTATVTNLRNIDPAQISLLQVQMGRSLAAFWDTLGWVYFQQGDLAKASRYLNAAWNVEPDGTVGDHLGQSIAKQGKKEQALETWAEALAAHQPDPDTRARMILMLGGNERIDALVEKARPEIAAQRTFALGKLTDGSAEGKFELLLSAGGADGSTTQVDYVKFLSGSEKLRDLGDRLRSLTFPTMFPDASLAKLVQIGTVFCTSSGDCSFVLALPDDVHSLN
jgi:tetratricopeptide (TPR) repeat protein/transglutaminase-like putative cysteine protease